MVLITAWVTYLLSMGLPTMYLDRVPAYGWEAFWMSAWFCVVPIDPLINTGVWIGTLSNVVMLFLSPAFHVGGKGAGKERFFNIVALVSGLWVWLILAIFKLEFFTVGYYVWALTHLAVGLRIFWKREYFDKLGPLPAGMKRRPPGPVVPPLPADTWPKDQTGDWDEGRKK
jgi:hypothetical protein